MTDKVYTYWTNTLIDRNWHNNEPQTIIEKNNQQVIIQPKTEVDIIQNDGEFVQIWYNNIHIWTHRRNIEQKINKDASKKCMYESTDYFLVKHADRVKLL